MSETNDQGRGELVIYATEDGAAQFYLRAEGGSVWLTQLELAELFQTTKQNISLHIRNILAEGELSEAATVKEYLTVQMEGQRKVKRKLEYYNLDVIISVGYRVKSKQGTQFRIWATNVLKDYLLKGYAINQRMDRIENNFEDLSKEVSKISLQLTTQDLPKQGISFASPFAPPLLMHLLDKLLHFRDSALIHQIAVVGFAGGNFVVDGR